MNEERKVQFGHSESERLVLTNLQRSSDGYYSLDAEICTGAYKGAARVFGQNSELEQLYTSLVALSRRLSGAFDFENLEGQIKIHCSISSTGTVYFDVAITDHRNRVECAFDTDPASLNSTIAALATAFSGN